MELIPLHHLIQKNYNEKRLNKKHKVFAGSISYRRRRHFLKLQKTFAESNAFVTLCILPTMFLFGLSFMFSRIALVSASAFSLLSWRFFTAFLVMNLLRVLGIWKIDLKGLPVSLLCIGLFHPILYFSFETFGIALTSVAESGIIISTFPVVSMILAALFLKEPPTKLQIASIILSVLGAVVVVLGKDFFSATFNMLGYFALFGAVFSGGLFYVVSRGTTSYSNSAKSYVMMGMGFIAFTAAAAVEHVRNGTVLEWISLPFRNTSFLLAILYLGALTSIAGAWVMNFSVARLGVHRASAFSGVATVVSVMAGILLMHEPFTWTQGAGSAMILLGVSGVNQFGQKIQ